ncbi:MAG: phosphatase PAP2 family protein [Chitinophagaceae bacterium]|jgi:undecaprenyl-diphosphatase|nr:phosphatase PAP2 family protein [Chitinophagaceae bacterium]
MLLLTFLASFVEKVWHWLDQADKQLFLKINTQWTNSSLDHILPWYRDSNTWIPLYLFLLLFTAINYKNKIWPWLLFIAVTATLSDQISSNFFKNFFDRPRPCNDLIMQLQGRLLLNRCPSSFSFTSSHATNHFAAAMFLFLTLKSSFKNWTYLFFFWAGSISYAQIYVGVHYPLDILGGTIIGCSVGYLTGTFYNKRFAFNPIESRSTV